jgi:TolB-like protein/Tfp pilus assembly protein PilF
MGDDEVHTHQHLTNVREQILKPIIAHHRGRIVKLMGDGLLVEFASVVDAVACGLDWQEAVAEHEGQSEIDARLRFRIGLNLGDVIVEGDDIYGEGVNIAARLETLAQPGGICLSVDAYRQAKGKIDAQFEDMGDRELKNVAERVRVYRIVSERIAPMEATSRSPALPLPDKPSVAVLPFQNKSGYPEQEYFADGISEDIITALSRISWLFVIARNTMLTYKGQAVNAREVARELGVRYVLEGSVRQARDKLRITALLMDCETGKQIWAEKYDRNLEDVFEIQDEITENIAGALEPQLALAEDIRAKRKTEQNLDAWDLVIRAMVKLGEFSKTGSAQALTFLDRAIEIDPTYARAYSQKAWTLAWRIHQGWEDIGLMLPESVHAAETALRYDPDDPWAYIALVFVAGAEHDGEKMLSTARKAIELNPNFALAHSFLGAALALSGNGADAFQWIEKARRLSPRDIFRMEFDVHTSMAYFQLGDYDNAAKFATKARESKPDHLYPYLLQAASYAHMGALEAARDVMSKILRLEPEYSLALAEERCVFTSLAERVRFVDGLRKAGLPAYCPGFSGA